MDKVFTPLKQALNKAYLKEKVSRPAIENFKGNLKKLLSHIDVEESEANIRDHLRDFLNDTWYKNEFVIASKGRTDLVIHADKTAKSHAAVLFEVKRPKNTSEMISVDNFNRKAMQELILYYLRERIDHENREIKNLIITDIYTWFIFDENDFERYVYHNEKLVKYYQHFKANEKNNDVFYKTVAKDFIPHFMGELNYTFFDIRDYKKVAFDADNENDKTLIPLYKGLSPTHLLKLPFANDSNSLDKPFYNELLHIIGLEETKDGGKKIITRKEKAKRNSGSLLENTIATLETEDCLRRLPNIKNFGETRDEQLFNVGLELVITWMNRLLFLKLLEAQLLSYHDKEQEFRFLNFDRVKDFDELNELFLDILAKLPDTRPEDLKARFSKVPYLNSSLFEISELESQTVRINSLKDRLTLPLISGTVLKDSAGRKKTGDPKTLEYIFNFLDAYDFSSEGSEDIQEESKTLINAAVLGLIFEKINGYKDGSFFTPGFVTMYMCRETIRRAVVQKFNERHGWNCTDLDDLKNHLVDRRTKADILEANEIINTLKICDPAVGSGHFLVSALNEIISIKSELRILADADGLRLPVEAKVENDELIVTDENGLFTYILKKGKPSSEAQRVQQTLFKEKQTIIENCLFGVDINPNSVKICRLRLWIELLKNAYYKAETQFRELETLPNIDINIKQGNSLISRFALDEDLAPILKKFSHSITDYRGMVHRYQHAQDKDEKRELLRLIEQIKANFRTEITARDPLFVKQNELKGKIYNLQQTGLFEPSEAEKQKKAVELDKLETELEKTEAKIEAIKSNAIFQNAFEWRFEFPEVLDLEGKFVGFDCVVGNPPYLPLENFSDKERAFFKMKFELFERKYETSVLFIFLGFQISKTNGQQAYIAPLTWQTGDNFSQFRKLIIEEKTICKIINLPFDVFEDAYIDTAIYFFENQKIQNHYEIFIFGKKDSIESLNSIDFQKIELRLLEPPHFKLILNPFIPSLIKRLEKRFPTITLGEITISTQGLSPSEFPKAEEKGEKIFPFLCEGNVYNYTLQIGKIYETDMSNKISLMRFYQAEPKILIRRIINRRDRLDVGYTEEKMVFKKDINPFILNDERFYLKFLLALIASKFMSFIYVNASSIATKDDFRQTTLSELRALKIPIISKREQQPFVDLIEEILAAKKASPAADTTALEKEVDRLVYELYGLTEEEIELIEKP